MIDGEKKPVAEHIEADLRAHLQRILASKKFARSNRLSSFLEFVVKETLAGREHRLKARVIAIEAMNRDESFNSTVDPIVSIQAGRLRRALDEYYQGPGIAETIRISLPKGSYKPVFESARFSDNGQPNLVKPNRGPTIAVVPLMDLGSKTGEEYFGIGLTQELVGAIAAFQELTVIAVPPLDEGDSIADATARFGREFNARFVLSGTFRRTEDRLIVRMELTDSTSAAIVWTDKITRDLAVPQSFDLEEEVARQTALAIACNYGVVPRTLTAEVHRKHTSELSVYDAILRHRHYQCVATNESRDQAIAALERAIQIEPDFALCWAMLSEAIVDAYGLRINSEMEVVRRGQDMARRAVALEPNCQHAWWALAYANFHSRDRDGVLKAVEKVIELNPNNGYLVVVAAWAMALVGQWNRGLSILAELMKQNPYFPGWLHLAPFLNHYRQGEFEKAYEHASLFNTPALAWDPILRAAALARLGRASEAETAFNELHSKFPDAAADPAHYLRGYIFFDELVDDVVSGLRQAGSMTIPGSDCSGV